VLASAVPAASAAGALSMGAARVRARVRGRDRGRAAADAAAAHRRRGAHRCARPGCFRHRRAGRHRAPARGRGHGAVLEFHGTGTLRAHHGRPAFDRGACRGGIVGALTVLFERRAHARVDARERCDPGLAATRGRRSRASSWACRVDLSQVRPVRVEPRLCASGRSPRTRRSRRSRAASRTRGSGPASLEVVVPGRASLAVWTQEGALAALGDGRRQRCTTGRSRRERDPAGGGAAGRGPDAGSGARARRVGCAARLVWHRRPRPW
jgi:hypothetical protein